MKQLETLSIVSPGFYGLNTQESGSTISPNFAQLSDNSVIDRFGRLGSRAGWTMQSSNGATTLSGNPIRYMLEHYDDDGSKVIISAGNHKILINGDEGDSFTDKTPAGYTITDNDWQGASLYDHAILTQAGHEPLIYRNGTASKITTFTGSAQNFGTVYPSGVIAAYGRFWAHTKGTVYWSTDIADTAFPCFCGGTSGSLNIASVLPHNVDEITGLAVHNDFLVIFCKNNVVIYQGASNPISLNFSLADVIPGVGCVARRSIQATGNDLLFLSATGIRSFGRLIQEKSLPMRDLSKNVRDDLVTDMNAEIANYDSLDHVVSVYSEDNAFYLLSFPSLNKVYAVDLRQQLQDGSARITTWSNYSAHSFLTTSDQRLLIGKEDGIGKYGGNSDNGTSYRVRFLSHFLDLGTPTTLKFLKQVKITVFGGTNQQFVIKIGTDYASYMTPYPFVIPSGGTAAEYGVGEYGVAEFGSGMATDSVRSSVSGSGSIIQVGFEADVNGSPLSVQSIDCYIKTGRTN